MRSLLIQILKKFPTIENVSTLVELDTENLKLILSCDTNEEAKQKLDEIVIKNEDKKSLKYDNTPRYYINF